jgi:hypothetical protein
VTNQTRWQSLCCNCGHVATRAARIQRYDRELLCRGCWRHAFQVVVGQNSAEDWREQVNYYGRYDPIADLQARWPDWSFECKSLHGHGEVIYCGKKLIELDSEIFDRDWRLALTHAIAHLDLGHHERLGAAMFEDECEAADVYAELLLDR